MFYLIKNNSVTPYGLFVDGQKKNDSVTPYVLFDDGQ